MSASGEGIKALAVTLATAFPADLLKVFAHGRHRVRFSAPGEQR